MGRPSVYMGERRHRHWAYLNEEGTAIFGAVFPDGRVPVASMLPSFTELESLDGPQRVYMVYLGELTGDQLDQVIRIVAGRFGVPVDVVRRDVFSCGLPLREALTRGSGCDNPGFFW